MVCLYSRYCNKVEDINDIANNISEILRDETYKVRYINLRIGVANETFLTISELTEALTKFISANFIPWVTLISDRNKND
jgi:hypothetical protein